MDDGKLLFQPGVISTSNEAGKVNSAVIGSMRKLDEQHLAMALGSCRTLRNLQINRQAVYLFYTPGESVLQWKGARLYLEADRFEESGELFDSLVAETEEKAGKMAASQLRVAIVFRVTEERPLIDFSG